MSQALLSMQSVILLSATISTTLSHPQQDPHIQHDIALAHFCVNAQKTIAQTNLNAQNVIHTDYDTFVKSKPSSIPLVTHQYLHTANDAQNAIAQVISCKLKSADAINTDYGAYFAGKQQRCKTIIEYIVAQIFSTFENSPTVFKHKTIIVDEDGIALIGPQWLNLATYQAVYLDKRDILHLRGKGMYVPNYWLLPVPKQFKGVHYCHFPNPNFIRAIIAGEKYPLLQ